MLDQFTDVLKMPSAESSVWILVTAVWFASLLGSPHCLGMCGPLASAVSKTLGQNIFYNLGRGLSYIMVGALFGFMGHSILKWSSEPVRYVATALMVLLILFISWRIAINKPLTLRLPNWFYKIHRAILKPQFQSTQWGELIRAGLAGIFTAGLPCGWLYTFAALAAATGSASRGAVTMLAFWLGTLPVMAFAPTLVGRLLGAVQNKSPKLAGLIVASSALFVIWMKWSTVVAHTSCH